MSSATSDQSEAAFAIDPADAKRIFGASNDTGLEVVRLYESADGGTRWTRKGGPAVPGGSCAHGAPSVAFGAHGREYLAFLASQYCGDSLTPYLVVTTRATQSARWEPLVRVAQPTWKYGFDDAPRIAVDESSGRVYVAWTRSLSKAEATIVVSSSSDEGKTWSAATPVSASLQHPHHATLAVAAERRPVRRRDRRDARRLDHALDRRREDVHGAAGSRAAACEPRRRLRAHGAGPAAEGAHRVRRP